MRIDKNDNVLGWAMSLVRDLLRRIGSDTRTETDIAAHLHISAAKAKHLADALITRGLLERVTTGSNRPGLVLTDLGLRLTHARFRKPIPLARADVLVQELLTRIDAINARDELVFLVAEVHVFGSCFRREADVADIDIAVRLEPRRPATDWPKECFERAHASGQRSLTFLGMLCFGDNEVFKLMKGTTQYFEIHPWNGFKRLNTPSCRIYPRPTSEDPG